ncbi:MAG: hypothetical protein WCK90_04815 [archaeon]
MNLDKLLFKEVNRLYKKRFKRFAKYYLNDSKKSVNKLSRDYEKSGKFPVHIIKAISSIKKEEYNSAVCILRGALPYSVLFEAYGWKVHYVLCGRRNGWPKPDMMSKRFNMNVDRSIKNIRGKKVLLIENNVFNAASSRRVYLELKNSLNIKKPSLFIDYYVPRTSHMLKFPKSAFLEYNPNLRKSFGKIYVASRFNVSKAERENLIKDTLDRIRHIK